MISIQDLESFAESIKKQSGCILCIDWGRAFCGLAISDPRLSVAMQLEPTNQERLMIKITELKNEHPIKGIVIGFPFKLDFSGVHEIGKEIIVLAETINQDLELPILLWDERMSTIGAFNALHFGETKSRANNSRIRRKQKVKSRHDSGAAQFILDGLIDQIKDFCESKN